MKASAKQFFIGYVAMLSILIVFAIQKASLGVDFTDEGFYLAAPLRLHFGEPLFSSELMTLSRPFDIFSALIFDICPSTNLYAFRLIGWGVNLLAFSTISFCCFRTSRSPWISLLAPSVALFCSNASTVTTPSYNNLSCAFLLSALSLRIIAVTLTGLPSLLSALASGASLFVAVCCYPTLVIVAAFLLAVDFIYHRPRIRALNASSVFSGAASLCFFVCAALFAISLFFSGALHSWVQRVALAQAYLLTSIRSQPLQFYKQLFVFLLSATRLFQFYAIASLVALLAVVIPHWRPFPRYNLWIYYSHGILSLSLLIIIAFSDSFYLLPFFCLSSLSMGVLYLLSRSDIGFADNKSVKAVLLASVLASIVYATSTAYWGAYYSWNSGALGLPFCFSIAILALLKGGTTTFPVRSAVGSAFLSLSVLLSGFSYYKRVYRDAPPNALTAAFTSPKLRYVRSTPERVRDVDALVAYLKPKLTYGEPLVAYDSCAMLYFVLDAHPAYGLCWAKQYRIPYATLQQLNAELLSRPLPRYAIRMLVDPANVTWTTAPRAAFADYPLDNTIMQHYILEKSLFPFEIWRLKASVKHDSISGRPQHQR